MSKRGIYIIIFILVVIVLVLASLMFKGKEKATIEGGGKTLPVAIIPEGGGELDTKEIISRGISEGPVYCEQLKKDNLKELCLQSYILERIKKEKDVSICELSEDKDFVRKCKWDVIMPLVARKYVEESQASGNENIVPSNINLCEELDNDEDREKCHNPKQAIEEDYNLLTK